MTDFSKDETVYLRVPLHLTPELIAAVRHHPDTACETTDEWHKKLGWLICAYEAIAQEIQFPTAGKPR